MLRLADSLVIPFDLTAMAAYIASQVEATASNYDSILTSEKIGKRLTKCQSINTLGLGWSSMVSKRCSNPRAYIAGIP